MFNKSQNNGKANVPENGAGRQHPLPPSDEQIIKRSVERTVEEYSETLKRLGNE